MDHRTKIILLFWLFAFFVLQRTEAKPAKSGFKFNDLQYDSKEKDIQETCQQCAKRTKSDIVYPMCLSNEDDVYKWCVKYLKFGMRKV